MRFSVTRKLFQIFGRNMKLLFGIESREINVRGRDDCAKNTSLFI